MMSHCNPLGYPSLTFVGLNSLENEFATINNPDESMQKLDEIVHANLDLVCDSNYHHDDIFGF